VNVHVVLGVLGKIRSKVQFCFLIGLVTGDDTDIATRFLGQTSGRGNQIEQPTVAESRICPRTANFSHNVHSLGR
jgi:hypothetical protein